MQILDMASQIIGFPRHLSQHVGGFLITRDRLSSVIPIENAAMEDRTVIQWEKDDLEDLGLLKVDVLGLGMLTAIRRGFDLIRNYDGREYTLATVVCSVSETDPRVRDPSDTTLISRSAVPSLGRSPTVPPDATA